MSLLKPRTDPITAAEAQFWEEQAKRAPQLLRAEIPEANKALTPELATKKVLGIGLGATLGAATLSKHVPGYWKLLTGGGATAAGITGWLAWTQESHAKSVRADLVDYANTLEQSPLVSGDLPDYLATYVTAKDIQKNGLDKSVLLYTKLYAIENNLYFPHGSNPQLSK